MKKQTLGAVIAALRKEKGMTQVELAEKLGVTDKAVSKWERDLSCPDIHSIPKLAEVLGVTVDVLMGTEASPSQDKKKEWDRVLDLILKAVPLAMGIALIMTAILKKDLELHTVAAFGGIGLFGISLYQLRRDDS